MGHDELSSAQRKILRDIEEKVGGTLYETKRYERADDEDVIIEAYFSSRKFDVFPSEWKFVDDIIEIDISKSNQKYDLIVVFKEYGIKYELHFNNYV